MEGHRFDELTRSVAAAGSRRSFLRKVVAATSGAVMALAGLAHSSDPTTEAKNKHRGKRAHSERRGGGGGKGGKGKGGKKNECSNNGDCRQPDNACEKGVCRGGKCQKETRQDGVECGAGQVCAAGACVAACGGSNAPCADGLTCCAGACVNTSTSFGNCGSCGGTCNTSADSCVNSSCRCGANAPCADGRICRQGACVCPQGGCVVTPGNLRGWLLFGEDPFSNNPLLTQIVDGPADPPGSGDGSVKLDPTAFGSFTENSTQAVLRTLQYAGTPVGDIETLAYSLFVPTVLGSPPTMQLAVVGTFNPDQFSSLVFIPGSDGNAAPQLDGWKDYTPSQTGNWRSTRDILAGNGTCLMRCSIGGCGTRVAACSSSTTTRTWAEIRAGIPNAVLNGGTLNAPNLNNGSFSFRIGRGDIGQGNVTNVVFNDDAYVFETV